MGKHEVRRFCDDRRMLDMIYGVGYQIQGLQITENQMRAYKDQDELVGALKEALIQRKAAVDEGVKSLIMYMLQAFGATNHTYRVEFTLDGRKGEAVICAKDPNTIKGIVARGVRATVEQNLTILHYEQWDGDDGVLSYIVE